MSPPSPSLLLLFLLFLSSSQAIQFTSTQQHRKELTASDEQHQPSSTLTPAEMAALRDIRSNLRDLPGSDFFSTWDFSSNPCSSFSGVVCSPDDSSFSSYSSLPQLRVSALTLGTGLADSPGLSGTLSPSIANLTALTDFIVYPGRISGPIPLEIGASLRRLRLLSISGNLISGPIPTSLAGLPDLHTLDLGHNHLNASIPPSLLTSSPSLKVLILAGGGISGEIPAEIAAATQLLHLDLRQNSLTGRLPTLPYTLRYISVSGNSICGPLDALASPPPDLAFLDLSMNAFSGQIPPAIFACSSLSSLLLQRNNLSGAVTVPPPSTTTPPSWAVVDLSHNMLSGEVPAELAEAGSLFLNNNRFTGAVPEEYGRSVYGGAMTTLYAQHNFLTGFPSPPLPLPDSVSICLSYNCMVPSSAAFTGCPASAGTDESRPAYQCSNNTTAWWLT